MKFTFKVQGYQTEAVDAVVRVFAGQPFRSPFDYQRDVGRGRLNLDDRGFANADLALDATQLLANVREIQREGNIHESEALVAPLGACSLDVEMETGTGKTYVYVKTMFELNRRYGWSKFIVVVPSIAIREGVKKSFEITGDHFMEHYGRRARFFVYDSARLNDLDDFSSSPDLSVMIINTQAFAASFDEEKAGEGRRGSSIARIIYTKRDEFGSRRPIDVIAANRPILILDEPQRMGKAGTVTQKALAKFRPLFALNYSATHAEKHNLVYVLDALDAYNKRLVKKIEVKGFEVRNLRGTDGYLYLERIELSPTKAPRARMELEVRHAGGVKREFKLLDEGDDLFALSNELEQYRGCSVSAIDYFANKVTFTNGVELAQGDVTGDVSEADMRRVQIRETILSHLAKEQALFKMGIKTLSLFFIDEVAKYRQYDADGHERLGEYGEVFEKEYLSVLDERRDLFDDPEYVKYLEAHDVREIHKGYFSIDKNGRSVDSKVKRGTDEADDISAYDLILKNKERLLSFAEPTRFIFSHSALREGWDNPNVFQICTLRHSNGVAQRRQEVGRGLRLCVNQAGDRMDAEALGARVQDVNTLTVVASESYATFVDALQKQTEAVLYRRPTKISEGFFTGRSVKVGGEVVKITPKQAQAICYYLAKNDYMDEEGGVTAAYREATAGGTLAPLPESLQPVAEGVHALVQSVYDESVLKRMVENGHRPEPLKNPLNERFERAEFQKLWNAINHKYAYTVSFESDELVRKAIDQIDAELTVSRLMYTVTTGAQRETLDGARLRAGESFADATSKTATLKGAHASEVRYDLVGQVAAGAVLTRRTVAKILAGISPSKFALYAANPEEFIAKVTRFVREQKAALVVDHITYNTIDGGYGSEIFTDEKLRPDLSRLYAAKKAVQDYVVTDGLAEKSVERRFAENLDAAEEVLVYAKLPRGFAIPTPMGSYSPDWAIVFRVGDEKHIYFIAETKGTMESLQLRPIEQAKIKCAKTLFTKLSGGKITYDHVDSYKELINRVMK